MAWNVLVFSHETTRFPLTGKHAQVACVKCHLLVDQGTAQERRMYTATPTQCADCHPPGKSKVIESLGK